MFRAFDTSHAEQTCDSRIFHSGRIETDSVASYRSRRNLNFHCPIPGIFSDSARLFLPSSNWIETPNSSCSYERIDQKLAHYSVPVWSNKDLLSQIIDAFAALERINQRVAELYLPINLYDQTISAFKEMDSLNQCSLEDKSELTAWGAIILKDEALPANTVKVRSEYKFSFEYEILEPLGEKMSPAKKTYTQEEVLRILEIVGRNEVLNPSLIESDKALLKTVGYEYGETENGFGGYSYLRRLVNGDREPK